MEHVHTNCLIYRDVKPENFLIGRIQNGTHNIVYIIGIYRIYNLKHII